MTDEQDLKYLADGRIVRVLARTAHQIVVELGHINEDDPDGEVFFDGTKAVRAVYDKPPVAAFDKEVSELEARKAELNASVHDLLKRELDAKKRVDALKKYDVLERIEDFLAGKITHYVIWDGYMEDYPAPRVAAIEDERSGDENRNRYEDLKLLVLYGSKNRSLEWKLSYYSDGSGSRQSHCIPCCSHEEAIAKAKAILADSFARYKWPSEGSTWPMERLINAAQALKAPIPEGYEERWRQHQIRGLQAEVQKYEKQRDEWQARLDDFIGKTEKAA